MEQNMHCECHHLSDAESAISGTCVIPEIKLAIEKGYKILDIHEVYEYQVTKYIQGYINTFLKLKAEAKGYPD